MRVQTLMKREKAGLWERLEHLAIWTVSVIGILIMLFLCWYAFRYTQYMLPGQNEISNNVRDSMTRNLLALGLAVLGMFVLNYLERRISGLWRHRICCFCITAAMLWAGVFSLLWVNSADRQPIADQAFLYGGASYFMEGDYAFLAQGGYCFLYPHQLGLIALLELLFHVTGPFQYQIFQYINIIFVLGTIFTGYCVMSRISKSMSLRVAYCALMAACMPLYLYSYWVYGELGSIFFCILTFYFLLRYYEEQRTGFIAGMVLSITFALIFRKNALIFLIALVLACGVYVLRTRDKRFAVGILLCCLIPWLSYQGIYKMYEIRSGYSFYGGIPSVTWVAMGLQNTNGTYGWYNDYSKTVFYENNMDGKATSEAAWQEIKDRMKVFGDNPGYAWHFFREKVLSQWNAPLYQSVFFSYATMAVHMEDMETARGNEFAQGITDKHFVDILNMNDMLQFVVFAGMLCYFIASLTRKGSILEYALAIAVIGGFLFSFIWEAKARYILPYYVVMFPYAALGYERMVQLLLNGLSSKQKDSKTVNIEDYRKTA